MDNTIDTVRLQYLETCVGPIKRKLILDFGCGQDALYARALSEKGACVIAADVYRNIGDLPPGVTYLPITVPEKIPLSDASVDFVWASHVLEHVCNLGLLLMEIRRIMIPGGMLAVAVPPFKYQVVNHFSPGWSVGQLAYLLAGFGFDCSSVRFLERGYNVLGAGVKRELLITPTHFGVNGVSVKSVMKYFPKYIQSQIQSSMANNIIRFDGHIKDTAISEQLSVPAGRRWWTRVTRWVRARKINN